MRISFGADKVKIRGPRVDGSWVVTFETGEYEQDKIAELLKIPQNTEIKVIVEVNNETKETAKTS